MVEPIKILLTTKSFSEFQKFVYLLENLIIIINGINFYFCSKKSLQKAFLINYDFWGQDILRGIKTSDKQKEGISMNNTYCIFSFRRNWCKRIRNWASTKKALHQNSKASSLRMQIACPARKFCEYVCYHPLSFSQGELTKTFSKLYYR